MEKTGWSFCREEENEKINYNETFLLTIKCTLNDNRFNFVLRFLQSQSRPKQCNFNLFQIGGGMKKDGNDLRVEVRVRVWPRHCFCPALPVQNYFDALLSIHSTSQTSICKFIMLLWISPRTDAFTAFFSCVYCYTFSCVCINCTGSAGGLFINSISRWNRVWVDVFFSMLPIYLVSLFKQYILLAGLVPRCLGTAWLLHSMRTKGVNLRPFYER